MDAWQLCHLAPSLVLPMRPDEATGLLIADVGLDRRRLRFGTRFGDRDFTKGRRTFEVPFPSELVPLLRAAVGTRAAGPLLRKRAIFEGRERPAVDIVAPGDVEAIYEADLLAGEGGEWVTSEQDTKVVLRRVLRRAGGVSTDDLSREFGKVLRRLETDPGVRFYDARSAVTTDMNRAGVPELELRYLTGHTTGDILNEYVTLDPKGAWPPTSARSVPCSKRSPSERRSSWDVIDTNSMDRARLTASSPRKAGAIRPGRRRPMAILYLDRRFDLIEDGDRAAVICEPKAGVSNG